MSDNRETCGTCSHGVPPQTLHKGAGPLTMGRSGWLSCEVRQATAEEQARYLSPKRAACSMFKQKQEAA